ncbi:uncharacterized protein LOC129597583 [Paramacrobiotus metropolitanus]|uniref:uncharacterized protein LOC129597583 n=1 Tax=Paramacrobiotus metropolitanus TaxID=2943436 RepID=UPI002445CB1A|nr:uncharacterized protein LOC129597583 [Paramacrobiotus metropolitanus]
MGKRGPRSKMTDDRIERVKELYRDGIAHRTIAKELGISETNIRRIISIHGIPKRERKLATLLSPQQEDGLVKFLLSLGPFRGKYRTLRTLMEEFANENGMRCTFTYSWRDGFVRRHRHRLPSHIIKLLSPKVQREDDVDSDLDILDTGGGTRMTLLEDGTYIKEPSVWKQKPKLNTQERAIKETRKAFVRGGLTKEEANELLIRLRVPGITEQMIPSPAQVSADVVAAALNNIFGETSSEPVATSSTQETTPEVTTITVTLPILPKPKKAPVNRKTPMKKTPFQLEILDKAFQKSTTCGDKRAKRLARILGLTPAQVIYWFHNTARHKRKMSTQGIMQDASQDVVQEDEIVEADGDDAMLGEGEVLGEGEGEAVLEGAEGDAVEEVDQEMQAEGETVEA